MKRLASRFWSGTRPRRVSADPRAPCGARLASPAAGDASRPGDPRGRRASSKGVSVARRAPEAAMTRAALFLATVLIPVSAAAQRPADEFSKRGTGSARGDLCYTLCQNEFGHRRAALPNAIVPNDHRTEGVRMKSVIRKSGFLTLYMSVIAFAATGNLPVPPIVRKST